MQLFLIVIQLYFLVRQIFGKVSHYKFVAKFIFRGKLTGINIFFLAYFLKGFSEKGWGPFNDRREAFSKPRKTQRKKRLKKLRCCR